MVTKEPPNFEALRIFAARHPELDFGAIEAAVHLLRLYNDLSNAFDAHFARHDLSRGRFMIMVMLIKQSNQPLAPAVLAESCGVTRATVTGLIDTLEGAGLVERVQNAEDRRSIEIRLTDKGRSLMDTMLPDHYRRLAGMMSDLSRDELASLTEITRKIAARVSVVRDP